jgi:hypothetical protein
MKNFFAAAACGIFIFLGCRQLKDFQSIDSEIQPFKEWLTNIKASISSEKITVTLANGNKSGRLDWSQAKLIKKASGDLVVVPFTFDESPYRNKSIIRDPYSNENPIEYKLLIKRDTSGKFDCRYRLRSITKDKSNKLLLYDVYYDITGKDKGAVLIKDKTAVLLSDEQTGSSTGRMQECTMELIVTRYIVCTGTTMDNTACTFMKRQTSRYHCESVPFGEEEKYSWFENEGGGGGDYQYDEILTDDYENKKIIDSLQGHPCAQAILAQIPSINAQLTHMIDTIFNCSADVNIYFKPNPAWTKDSLDNGSTLLPYHPQPSYYDQIILMNPWVMDNSSTEYILSTFLHEALHAYMWYRYILSNANMDTAFKRDFPLFYNYGRPLTDFEERQHMEMALKYVGAIANAVKAYNPNLTDTVARSLAWKGLQSTSVWKNLADTDFVKQVGNDGRRHLNDTAYKAHNFKKCP